MSDSVPNAMSATLPDIASEPVGLGPSELQTLLRAIATMSCEVAEQLEFNSSGIGQDLVKCGSVAAAREKGLYRMEGKEYVVKDGDVMLFKFNV